MSERPTDAELVKLLRVARADLNAMFSELYGHAPRANDIGIGKTLRDLDAAAAALPVPDAGRAPEPTAANYLKVGWYCTICGTDTRATVGHACGGTPTRCAFCGDPIHEGPCPRDLATIMMTSQSVLNTPATPSRAGADAGRAEDSVLLDWLEAMTGLRMLVTLAPTFRTAADGIVGASVTVDDRSSNGPTLREAIRAAMQSAPPSKQEDRK